MSLLLPEKFPESIDKAVSNAVEKPTKEVGDIFNDLLYLVFGGVHFNAEKRRIKYKYALEELEKSCKEKIDEIPLENRVDPNTQTVCQALEDAKYCVENKEIRDMFARLIASTMDSRIMNIAHPSFSTILKQMTSEDAKIFTLFRGSDKLPVCNFVLNYKDNSHSTLLYYVYFKEKNAKQNEIESNALTLSSLERLGLLHLHFEAPLAHENLYQVYEESDFFQIFKKNITIVKHKWLFKKDMLN